MTNCDLLVPNGCSPSQGVSKPPPKTCYTVYSVLVSPTAPAARYSKWDQVGADLMTRIRNPGQDQPTVKTSSTDTRDHRKLKWRIGEGFIAEISEGDTFEKPAPMETGLLKCFTKRSTGNSIRQCKSETFVLDCLWTLLGTGSIRRVPASHYKGTRTRNSRF